MGYEIFLRVLRPSARAFLYSSCGFAKVVPQSFTKSAKKLNMKCFLVLQFIFPRRQAEDAECDVCRDNIKMGFQSLRNPFLEKL